MNKLAYTRTFLDYLTSIDQAHIRETLGEIADDVKTFLDNDGSQVDTKRLCHHLMSNAPYFNGKIYAKLNLSSVMRCAAREIRFATA